MRATHPSVNRGANAVHRCAILLVILALAVIITGAFSTSAEIAARQSHAPASVAIDEILHRALGIALIVFTLGIGIWLLLTPASGWLRALAWIGFAMLGMDAALGWATAPLPPAIGVFHALLAHLFLALMVVVAVGTSSGWNREPVIVDGSERPLLRPAAAATPPVVFLQIALGAAYRHDVTGVMPHIAVAMGVAFLALIVCSVVLQNFPEPKSMRRAAVALIAIVLTQVCLGIAAFVMLLLNFTASLVFVPVTVGHVTVGAATLAASVVMAIEVRRHVSNEVPGSGDQRVA
jgi:heme A synthase